MAHRDLVSHYRIIHTNALSDGSSLHFSGLEDSRNTWNHLYQTVSHGSMYLQLVVNFIRLPKKQCDPLLEQNNSNRSNIGKNNSVFCHTNRPPLVTTYVSDDPTATLDGSPPLSATFPFPLPLPWHSISPKFVCQLGLKHVVSKFLK